MRAMGKETREQNLNTVLTLISYSFGGFLKVLNVGEYNIAQRRNSTFQQPYIGIKNENELGHVV